MSTGGRHGKNQAIAEVITDRIVAGYLRRGGRHTLHAGFSAVHGFLHALPSLLTDARRRRAFSFMNGLCTSQVQIYLFLHNSVLFLCLRKI